MIPKCKKYWINVPFVCIYWKCFWFGNILLLYICKTCKKLYQNSLVNKWSTKDKYLFNESLLRYVIESYSPCLHAVETTFV